MQCCKYMHIGNEESVMYPPYDTVLTYRVCAKLILDHE